MILVVGATGVLGLEICRRLRARGMPVRALVRPQTDLAVLLALGVELVRGDLTRGDSLAAACNGAEVVISAASGLHDDTIEAVDRTGQIALADAARAADVRHTVTISPGYAAPLIAAERAVERHLAAIGQPHTTLRGGFYMDFWLGAAMGFDLASRQVRVLGSGTRPTTWIAREDVAEFAVLAALEASPESATIELGGPRALSQLDVVRIAEDIGGRAIAVTHLPELELDALRARATTPAERTLAELMAHVANGDVVDMREVLERFPMRQTPVRDYVRRVLASAATPATLGRFPSQARPLPAYGPAPSNGSGGRT